jgi:gamma-glutamyltranspeptidase/glutathione hydrolase
MSFSKNPAPMVTYKGRDRSRQRQCVAALLTLGLVLVGCSSKKGPEEGELGFARGFLGGVAADEPRAATIGRDVLSAGGNAVDAAVAVFFTMTVTRPSVAGLASSGQCLVYNDDAKRVDSIDFVAPPGIPGAPRGMFAMHAKYGRLRWEQLVASGESLARFGHPVSRGFARDIAAASSVIAQSPDLARIYRQSDGSLPGEGAFLQHLDLAATLGVLRRAPGDFYNGAFARQYADAAQSMGLSVTTDALRTYSPAWRDTIQVSSGLLTSHFTQSPGGQLAARMWAELAAQGAYEKARGDAKATVIADSALRALPQGVTQMAVEGAPAGASFVVADRYSGTVACSFSMGKPFGSGRVVSGTGIVPAAPLPVGEQLAIAPMLTINPRVHKMFFASAASGGAAAPTAMIEVALGVMVDNKSLTDALAAPRIHPVAPGTILREPQVSLGLVNGFNCPKGLISPGGDKPEGICEVATDRRGFGLALHQ